MPESLDRRQADLLAEIATRFAGDAASFARQLYQGVAAADLLAIGPDQAAAAADSLWRFGAGRAPGAPAVRAFRPTLEQDGWSTSGFAIEIVNDDMPFLVDSVAAAITGEGLTVDLLLHPIVRVERDSAGRRLALSATGALESQMQIRVLGLIDDAQMKAIEARLLAVLADVRAAVEDWGEMKGKAIALGVELAAAASSRADGEAYGEAKQFLDWLAADHFTFLGYREIRYEGRDREAKLVVVPHSGLGVLRHPDTPVFEGQRNLSGLPASVRAFLELPEPLLITKANQKATVHRAVPLDVVGIKRLDATGRVVAERRFVGLFTSSAHTRPVFEVPIIRRKVAAVLAHAGFAPNSHDGKALAHILATFPRDELWQIDAESLHTIAMGILQLQERQRIALFVRRDPFERFVSNLVYIPTENYDPGLRQRFQAILSDAWGGPVQASRLELSDAPLVRLAVRIDTKPGGVPALDVDALQARLAEAGRSWSERVTAVAFERHGPEGIGRARRWAQAFPAAYREALDATQAVADLDLVERARPDLPAVALIRQGEHVSVRLASIGTAASLSVVLPMLENRGLTVHTEQPFALKAGSGETIWLQHFDCRLVGPHPTAEVAERFAAGFLAGWTGKAEEDGFNRLTLLAGLEWRDIVVLRAYAKYLKQAGFTFSQSYIEATLARHAAITELLVSLFRTRFDPAISGDREVASAGLTVEIEHRLDQVSVLDEDRILRRYVNLIQATLRTNAFQPGADGAPKEYLSFKIDSGRVEELPKPRPLVEVWVYAPDTEAIHLRGGRVARGGIRWSDRREDFRTEILGLMKAQNVKNAVIVPVGSKGGFVVKRPAPPEAGRAAQQERVVHSYKTLMRGLLDVTDNRRGADILHPPEVVRHDSDDPYLVVAADKGTATFSDIANGVSADYGFWLGDAFASGGSKGYDHKQQGITARGAWVAVERQFRELGVDLATQAIRVVGIGDMGGDVFGNGLLHSNRLKLVGAFNHLHIFLDPNPDPAASFLERQRLFRGPKSAWTDYDPAVLSPGGLVVERSAKSVRLTAEVKALLGFTRDTATPADLIQALLRLECDLLWFGGIGTFIKASDESHADAGDRANDGLRIDAPDLRARVIGEGANLGMTQKARIEAAQHGVRLDTDAIHNSAGVDMSDHEVNIKILLTDPVGRGQLDEDGRTALLAEMSEEVAHEVLRDNYLQTLSLSMAEHAGAKAVDDAIQMMRRLEQDGGLERGIEFLPDDTVLEARRSAGGGITRPELAVLMAYAKNMLYRQILSSDLPDDPFLGADLTAYFPQPLRDRFPEAIQTHGLRREIIATGITNEVLNRLGPSAMIALEATTACPAARLAEAFVVIRELFDLSRVWATLEALDGVVAAGRCAASRQIALFRDVAEAAAIAIRWLVKQPDVGTIGDHLVAFGEPVQRLIERLPGIRPGFAVPDEEGLPPGLALTVASLGELAGNLDILKLAPQAGGDIEQAGRAYYEVAVRCGITRLEALAARIEPRDRWSRAARAGLLDDLARHQEALAARQLADANWTSHRRDALEDLETMIADLERGTPDLAKLAVAERALRAL
ncbi:MAG: NAD-glutamate dehydrogenase [Alphaproteobacteria bacterium]|nr:MAG: NAD-glutamate dehydrogenase [Alphaproteobacteria bacterium]